MLRGTVERVSFLGDGIDYHVRVAASDLVLRVAAPTSPRRRAGESVDLHIDPAACVLLADPPAERGDVMPSTFVTLPPTVDARDWAKQIASAVPALSVVVAEDAEEAARALAGAEAAYGTLPGRCCPGPHACAGSRRRRPRPPPGGTTRS